MLLGDLGELVADEGAQLFRIFQDLGELRDRCFQLAALLLELNSTESRQPAERHLEDVVGLDLRELEDFHQPGASVGRVVRCPDDRDHVVDVENGDQQAFDQMETFLGLGAGELRPAPGYLVAVLEIDGKQISQCQSPRLTVDQGDRIDREVVLDLGQFVKLLHDGVWIEAGS